MLMEEEITCSSPLHDTESISQQSRIHTWTTVGHQYINGEQEEVYLGQTDAETILEHGVDELNVSSKMGRATPDEEKRRCELMIWPVCPSSQLSFATVQWDMPAPFSEKPVTDTSSANELSCGDAASQGSTSPLLYQFDDGSAELSSEEREERDGFNSRPLSSHVDWTGSSSEPCDAASVQDVARQETEKSTFELVNKSPLGTDTEDEDEPPLTVETLYLVNTEEAEGFGGEEKCFVDVKLEEEQEESAIPLTAQGEEERRSEVATKDEHKEEDKEEEEQQQLVITVVLTDIREEAEAVRCLSDVEVLAAPQKSYDTEPTVNSHKLIAEHPSASWDGRQHSGCEEDNKEVQEQIHKDVTEETEMCPDVDDTIAPDAVDKIEEEVSENTERTNNLTEISELEDDCDGTTSSQPEQPEFEQLEKTNDPKLTQLEELHVIEEEELVIQRLEESPGMELSQHADSAGHTEGCTLSDQPVCVKDPEMAEQHAQTDPEPDEQSPRAMSEELVQSENSDELKTASEEAEVNRPTAEAPESKQVGLEPSHQAEEFRGPEYGGEWMVMANGEQHKLPQSNPPHLKGGEVEREMARLLAERLFKLEDIQRVDVVKHLDKDNDFSRAVGEEYLKFFDFSGQTLDRALRSFLKVVVLIGESQERERVLHHFACRYHQCNPNAFSSSGSVLALTCALMLLNTDLHGQHVGKSMSSSKFVSNLEGMNEDENFNKDLLKSLYNSIKSDPLEWAIDEEELKTSVLSEEDVKDEPSLRSKTNPFQVVSHDKKALVVKEGFLQRKLHANTDGKRTPWGKRGWKTFYGILKGMVLYLQKDDYRKEHQTNEEVVSVHHSVAEPASDYTKKPHVFRLQTADWRVFLFQASSKVEMNSWISRFNLVSALHSAPPFPAAVGSQRKFFRPILPASQSAHTLERQLQSHVGMLESFKADLSYLQQNPPEGRKARAKEQEEHRVRAEYLQHEIFRFEIYIQVMEGWMKVKKISSAGMSAADLNLFDKAVCDEEDMVEEGELKKSHSSPSLELEIAAPTVVKVRRNISERRTYRRPIIPRWNKED